MLTRQNLAVAARGEVVTLAVGNVAWSLEFDFTLKLAGVLAYEARLAKSIANCGRSGSWNVASVLTDLNAPPKRRQRFEKALPEFLRSHDVVVRHRGQLVDIGIGSHTLTLGWEDARKVAKWLRLRGKQARNAANERAHWSKIAQVAPNGEPQC